jgi:adenylosuccinate lyase
MELNTLTALSPIDGRYRAQLDNLATYFSEFALMQYRLRVEVEYFIALAQKKIFELKRPQTLNKQASEVGLFSVGAQGGVGGDGGAQGLGPYLWDHK